MSSPSPGNAKAEEDGKGSKEKWKRGGSPPVSSCSAQTSSASVASSPSPSAAAINLRREYTIAVQTDSYNEMWAEIHRGGDDGEILRPDRASIDEALRSARPTQLTRLVSHYLDSSERASDLFLSLRRSVDLAHQVYAPITDLLGILPASDSLSLSQCDRAFDVFLDLGRRDNPFPTSADAFRALGDIRACYSLLKQQLDLRLLAARRRHRFLRRATVASAACLVVSAAGAAAAALVLASHALLGLATICCFGGGDVLAGRRRRLRERMAETETAAREIYVLDNNLSTVERLVARLHAAVESDRVLVRLGIDRGRGQRHPVEEVVRQLHKNHPSFLHQLVDLDEHVCLCLAALNRARYLLLQQIHQVLVPIDGCQQPRPMFRCNCASNCCKGEVA